MYSTGEEKSQLVEFLSEQNKINLHIQFVKLNFVVS
jgi:hypothetical protein